MESVAEIAIGVAVESVLCVVLAGTVYRMLSGRFLIPKREVILPYQRGVVFQDNHIVRVVGPGRCWRSPKQRIVLCDVRPRPLQMVGVEAVGSDRSIVRFSLTGEYYVSDPATFFGVSREAANSFVAATRKALVDAAREQTHAIIVSNPDLIASRIRELVAVEGRRLGMDFISLEIWECLHIGWLPFQQQTTDVSIIH